MTENQMGNDDEDEAKLLPEWGVSADNQVVLAGVAVAAVLALLFGWNWWQGRDDETVAAESTAIVIPGVNGTDDPTKGTDTGVSLTPVDDTTTTTAVAEETTTTTEAEVEETTTTTEAEVEETTTTAAALGLGDVQGVLDPLDGDLTAAVAGGAVTLTGFVATDAESDAAEAAALGVDGVESVDNQLVVLQPLVVDALDGAEILDAEASGVGVDFTIAGVAQSEEAKEAAGAAVAAITGIGDVTNDIEASVAVELNELPQVQFAYNSAEILPESFDVLDSAATMLQQAGDASFEIQGYTDVQGPGAANLSLSQRRADAVRQYLVDAGVSDDVLNAVGKGETTQFGPELESNRLVLFVQTS